MRKNFVYFISDGSTVKIGYSNHPHGRVKELQVGNPKPLELRALMPGGPLLEAILHEMFKSERVPNREWFQLSSRLEEFILEIQRSDRFLVRVVKKNHINANREARRPSCKKCAERKKIEDLREKAATLEEAGTSWTNRLESYIWRADIGFGVTLDQISYRFGISDEMIRRELKESEIVVWDDEYTLHGEHLIDWPVDTMPKLTTVVLVAGRTPRRVIEKPLQD